MSSGSSNINIGNGIGSMSAQLPLGQAGQVLTTNSTNSGGYGGGGYPGVYIGSGSVGTSPAVLTPQQQQDLKDAYDQIAKLTGASTSFPQPPTQAELTELEALEEQRQRDMTQQQVDNFKKVPAPIRQRLVDDILWHRELANVEAVDHAKSARQLELESKKSLTGNMYGSGGSAGSLIYGGGGISWGGPTISSTFPYPNPTAARTVIPSRMTEEDVIQAHNEQTMEEECLSQD